MIDIIRFYNDDCVPFEDGMETLFSVFSFIAVAIVWICIYLAIFKGVHSSSYIVWATVPLPIIFIIIMIIKGATLPGAGAGVRQYL
jgi:solute carrier family 6 serotonin transporter-like protein 4